MVTGKVGTTLGQCLDMEGIMELLEYIGVDPDTETGDSPTVWLDREKREFVVQGWLPDAELLQRVAEVPAPHHEPGVPAHEGVVRVPFRMAEVLRKALDAADDAG